MKKILALIMLLVLAFSFAACGGSPTPEPAPSGGDEPAPAPADEYIIGFNTNGLTNETMSFMVDVMRDYCNKNNIYTILESLLKDVHYAKNIHYMEK